MRATLAGTQGQPQRMPPACLPPTELADLWILARDLSPRRALRVDVGDHAYISQRVALNVPEVPYALYLADAADRYRLLAFDLDAGRASAEVVTADLARLTGWLNAAGWNYAVAVSGPAGGRHVWASVPDGIPAAEVAAASRHLAALLPTLDYGMWRNPRAGACRPIGSPHRHGGRSVPVDGTVAAVAALRAGNSSDSLARLVAVLPPITTAVDVGQEDTQPSRRYPLISDNSGSPVLGVPRRALSVHVAGLAATAPEDGDASRLMWRVLVGAALAGWTRVEAGELLATCPAGEHLRTRATLHGRRHRPETEAGALLTRQWARAVETASELAAPRQGTDEDSARVREVTAAVAAVEAMAEAMPWRWATQAGPADRAVLRAVCSVVLAACSTTVAVDVRRLATRTGRGIATVSRALHRLARACPIDGRPWLRRVAAAEGTRAAVWALLPIDTDGQEDADTSETDESPQETGHVDTGGTQGRSPRPEEEGTLNPHPPWETSTTMDRLVSVPNRECLARDINRTRDIDAADIWDHRAGLGHHTARTYIALLRSPQTAEQLTSVTGYTPRTVLNHITRLTNAGLAARTRGRRWRAGDRSLSAAAKSHDVDGRGAERARRHTIDRAVHAWWLAEQAWRNEKKANKPRLPRGRRPDPAQSRLPVDAAVDPLTAYGRFPTRVTAAGVARADYATAAAIVAAHLTPGALIRAA